jgi:hypothetical protein
MQTSEQINELAAALSKAQSKITGALKDSKNPFFSSKYADLASCWDAARQALTENNLSVVQTTARGEPVVIEWETTSEKTGEVSSYSVASHEMVIETTLFHSSGQWIRSQLPLVPRDVTPQGIGSAITYGRRYGLTAMVGIAQVDDDGNHSSGKDDSVKPEGWRSQDTRKVTEYRERILSAINEGADLKAVDIWKEAKNDHAFGTALWVTLPGPVKTMIKSNMDR